MRRLGRLVLLLSAILLLVTGRPSQVRAAGSCTFNLSASGDDSIFSPPNEPIVISATNVTNNGEPVTASSDGEYKVVFVVSNTQLATEPIPALSLVGGNLSNQDITPQYNSVVPQNPTTPTNYVIKIWDSGDNLICQTTILVGPSQSVPCSALPPEERATRPECQTDGGTTTDTYEFCLQAAKEDVGKCQDCSGQNKIWTAFGCISKDPQSTVTDILKIGLGMAGGFVLLTILYGSFLLTTSSGDPKRIQEGQEMVTSAIMGLLFIIFSIVILQFIGVKLLQIPGFGTKP